MLDISGKKVIVRVDFNVPVKNDVVVDDFRIAKTLATIEFLRGKGAVVVLISHIENDESNSLLPVAKYLKKFFELKFASTLDEVALFSKTSKAGDIILVENLRFFEGEKNNDSEFAKKLASLGDFFVNEAFSVSHRSHASIVGVPKLLPSYAGLLFGEEVEMLSKAFSPEHPFVFILGGKKAETKTPLVEKFITVADKLFIGGAIANDFLKARGIEVGKSVVSKDGLVDKAWPFNPKIVLPRTVIVDDAKGGKKVGAEAIGKSDKAVDVGSGFVDDLKEVLKGAKFVIWNGTLGWCEGGFSEGTRKTAETIVSSGVFSIVGGGDTVAALGELGNLDKFSFVSTGGGAMLDFLANETLPGIEALQSSF